VGGRGHHCWWWWSLQGIRHQSRVSKNNKNGKWKMEVKMIIFAKAKEGFDFLKMIHFCVDFHLILMFILWKWNQKWAKNGPKMATVNNPIHLMAWISDSPRHVAKLTWPAKVEVELLTLFVLFIVTLSFCYLDHSSALRLLHHIDAGLIQKVLNDVLCWFPLCPLLLPLPDDENVCQNLWQGPSHEWWLWLSLALEKAKAAAFGPSQAGTSLPVKS